MGCRALGSSGFEVLGVGFVAISGSGFRVYTVYGTGFGV